MGYTAVYTITNIGLNKYCVTYWFTFIYGTAVTSYINISLNGITTRVVQVQDPFENLLVNDSNLVVKCDQNSINVNALFNDIKNKYKNQVLIYFTPKSFVIDTTGSIKITHSISSKLINLSQLPKTIGSSIIVEVFDTQPQPAPTRCTVL